MANILTGTVSEYAAEPFLTNKSGGTIANVATRVVAEWGNTVDEQFEQINACFNAVSSSNHIRISGNAYVSGAAYVGGDAVIVTGETLTLGAGAGSSVPSLTLDKGDAQQSVIDFDNESTTNWRIADNNSEWLMFQRGASAATLLQFLGTAGSGNRSQYSIEALTRFAIGDGSSLNPTASLNAPTNGATDLHFEWGSKVVGAVHLESFSGDLILHTHPTLNGAGVEILRCKRSDQTLHVPVASVLTGAVTAQSNLTLDSASPTLTVGDGSGSPNLVLDKDDFGLAKLIFQKASNPRWQLQMQVNEDFKVLRFNPADNGDSYNCVDLDRATGEMSLEANLSLTSSSPTLTVGDGTGTPILYIDGGEDGSNDPTIRFATTGSHQWALQQDESANSNFRLFRYINGSFQDTVIDVDHTNSDISIIANLDLDSASPNLTLGDGSGGPIIILDKADGSEGQIRFNNEGNLNWIVDDTSSEALRIRRYKNNVAHNNAIVAASDGDWSLEADLSLTSSSPTLTLGDGGGQPQIVLDKADASQAVLKFSNEGTRRWQYNMDNGENFEINRYDANGDFAGLSLEVASSDGDITMEANLSLTSSSPNLTLGDGSGVPRIIINKDPANVGRIDWQTNGTARFRLQHQTNEDLQLYRYNSAGSDQTSVLQIDVDDGTLSVEANLNLTSSSPTLTVGDGTSNAKIVVDQEADGSGSIVFNSGGSIAGGLRFGNADPIDNMGANGDIYINRNGSVGVGDLIWHKEGGVWVNVA